MEPGRHLGVVLGVVLDKDDPDGLGRVKVRFPTMEDRESDWARVVALFGGTQGGKHGTFFRPKKDDEVIVAFENGDPRVPIVLGAVYSKNQKPPTSDKDDHVIRTPAGHILQMSEVQGQAKLELKSKSGLRVTLDDEASTVTVEASQTVVVKGAQTVKVEGQSVTVKAQSATIDSPAVVLGGASGSFKAVLGDLLITALKTHTHTCTAPGVESAPSAALQAGDAFLSTTTKLAG